MRPIDADAMIEDLLTVNPQYQDVIDFCVRITKAQPTINMGVSEQEPILNKIRAEIDREYKWLIKTSYTSDIDIAFRSIFRLIDKYKAESENQG